MHTSLEMEAGEQIIASVSRLDQLAKLDSKEPNAIAEAAGLQEHIKNQLFQHAGHLLGCWFTIKNEYEPFCNVFASISNRATHILQQRAAREAALTAKQAEQQPEQAATTAIVDEMAPLPGESNLVAPEGAPLILTPEFRKGKK
jgi:hypothetical protein